MKITDYQLIDHGIDHAQYFQGCGVSFTKYTMCVTGAGSNFKEAIEDCFEQIALTGKYDTEEFEKLVWDEEGYDDNADYPTEPNTNKYHEENELSEMYYYVSIRFNNPEENK